MIQKEGERENEKPIECVIELMCKKGEKGRYVAVKGKIELKLVFYL